MCSSFSLLYYCRFHLYGPIQQKKQTDNKRYTIVARDAIFIRAFQYFCLLNPILNIPIQTLIFAPFRINFKINQLTSLFIYQMFYPFPLTRAIYLRRVNMVTIFLNKAEVDDDDNSLIRLLLPFIVVLRNL